MWYNGTVMSKAYKRNKRRNRRIANSRYDLAHADESTWQHFDKSQAPNTPITSSLYDSRSTRIVTAWKRDGRTSMPHDSGYFERNDHTYKSDKSEHIPHGMNKDMHNTGCIHNDIGTCFPYSRWDTIWNKPN